LVLALLVGAGPLAIAQDAGDESPGVAKNVILLIPDGMGETHVAAMRNYFYGRDEPIGMDRFPIFTQVNTFSDDNLVTDSAAASTAIATGTLTSNGVIGFDPEGNSVVERSVLLLAGNAGKSTGLVAEVPIGHATPAGFASAVEDRSDLNSIVQQYLDYGVEVLLGGGEANFLPQGQAGAHCIAETSLREDGVNLLAEYSEAGYEIVTDREAMLAAPAESGQLLGLFACNDMEYEMTRQADEPTTAEKTQKAIEILDRNDEGFFLMVERGKIDWAAEDNDGLNVIGDTMAFDDAVAVALDFAEQDGETLVLAMADHEAGGMSLVGSEERAHETFPTADGTMMYVAYSTQPGHTGVPIALRAFGPGSEMVAEMNGTDHLIDVYALMVEALGLSAEVAAEATPTA
jgi:alkaline phosphatase